MAGASARGVSVAGSSSMFCPIAAIRVHVDTYIRRCVAAGLRVTAGCRVTGGGWLPVSRLRADCPGGDDPGERCDGLLGDNPVADEAELDVAGVLAGRWCHMLGLVTQPGGQPIIHSEKAGLRTWRWVADLRVFMATVMGGGFWPVMAAQWSMAAW